MGFFSENQKRPKCVFNNHIDHVRGILIKQRLYLHIQSYKYLTKILT